MILDLSKKEHVPLIQMYKKCKGITLVDKYFPELTPINKMYVIDSLEDWEKVEHEFPEKMMTARCDSPKGVNGKLPSGQTFDRNRVKGYIQEVKSSVPDGVIILEDMKKGTNERIHTGGGVCFDVRIGEYIYMDYVCKSFDCREICLGKAAHETWNIPWEEVLFMKDSAYREFKTSEISQESYIQTAKERIMFLVQAFPDKKNEILETMPKRYQGMDIQLFRKIRDNIIFPLYMKKDQFSRDGLKHFGIEVNILEYGTLVPMEISVSDRFKQNNIENVR